MDGGGSPRVQGTPAGTEHALLPPAWLEMDDSNHRDDNLAFSVGHLLLQLSRSALCCRPLGWWGLQLGSPRVIIRGGSSPAGVIFEEGPGEEMMAGSQPTKREIKWAVPGTHS